MPESCVDGSQQNLNERAVFGNNKKCINFRFNA